MIPKENILDLKIRRDLYDFIDKHPGLHLREISRRINIPRTTIRYHLKFLKKQELIKEKFEGRYKRIYITKKMGTEDKKILSLLRQRTPCRIFL